MIITHCNITGFKVDTSEKDSVLCDKCCFQDCEVECMEKVPCRFGWYYKESKTKPLFHGANENAVDLLLMKNAPLTQIEHRKTTNTYVGIRGHEPIIESKSYLFTRIVCLKDMKHQALDAILSNDKKKKNGVYVYTFRGVTVGIERTKREAKAHATRNIKDYFDIMIEKELLDGNRDSQQN